MFSIGISPEQSLTGDENNSTVMKWDLKQIEADIIKDNEQNNLQYENYNDSTRKIKKNLEKKVTINSINNNDDKGRDDVITNCTIVFPLPTKDPLLSHRKVFNVAETSDAASSHLFT